MNFWVVKCRQKKADGKPGWHWDNYFEGYCDDNRGWGGEDWIKNNESKKYIRDEVRKGDFVVCYQYEGRKIVGLTRMSKGGCEEIKGSDHYNLLFFIRSKSSFRLNPPITIQNLRDNGSNPKCFGHGRQGTVFPLDSKEFKEILKSIGNTSPKLRNDLGRWLRKVGYEYTLLVT